MDLVKGGIRPVFFGLITWVQLEKGDGDRKLAVILWRLIFSYRRLLDKLFLSGLWEFCGLKSAQKFTGQESLLDKGFNPKGSKR